MGLYNRTAIFLADEILDGYIFSNIRPLAINLFLTCIVSQSFHFDFNSTIVKQCIGIELFFCMEQ